MKIGFIGAGKVGTALGQFFANNGKHITGYTSRSEGAALAASKLTSSTCYYDNTKGLLADSDMIFITVPDKEIKTAWEQISTYDISAKIICHCSGAISSEIFKNIETLGACAYSIHPLAAVANKKDSRVFTGKNFTIEGSPHNLEVVSAWLESLPINVSVISTEHKVLYHAAAVVASNFMVALADIAQELFLQSGFDNTAAITSLMNSSAENIRKRGVTDAITGPIERNDIETLNEHIKALQHMDADIQQIYHHLSVRLLKIAKEKNKNTDYTKIESLLRGDNN